MFEFLIAGMKKELQQAWILTELDQDDVETISLWAIKKEARMETLKYNQNGGEEPARINKTPSNQDGRSKTARHTTLWRSTPLIEIQGWIYDEANTKQ